ncbi:outer membrane protein [Bradyrhizobium iriomotense]|uniref:outer membrane protein n=1 Tax=Bradyrhizobium iriomotense TaxID=441950 RepID=UPI001B8A3D23|nr:outer membrane protein [Bradyrhizobium iriomotense]MBR0783767.1 porin family protein [Bradyrhizobium iriomotense]
MKITALALALAVTFPSLSMAADMAVKARPAVVASPSVTWTGWYAGLNVGGAWNDTSDTVLPVAGYFNPALLPANPARTDSADFRGSGFTGGVQLGYNWQADRWLLGIETDINYNGVRDSNSVNRPLAAPLTGSFIHAETERLNWFGTVRGRIGGLVTPSFLLYATGGLAYGQVKSTSNLLFTASGDTYVGSLDQTRVGWTAGAGGEWKFAPNWSLKAEYLYVDLGKTSYTDTCITPVGICNFVTPPIAYQTDLHVRENVARFGVNYQFGGPIVAKY